MELDVRSRNLALSEPLEHLVARRLDFALGRFSSEIRRVDVKLSDAGGPRGSEDKRCRVEVTLHRGGTVHAEGADERVRDAIDLAAHRVRRRMARRLARDTGPRRMIRLAG